MAETRGKSETKGREVRIAAVGDLHYDATRGTSFRDMFAEVNQSADILVLCGDMTTHGKPEQMAAFMQELAGIDIPIVAVLGNHDYEAGQHEELSVIMQDRGIKVLDGTTIEIDGVGFCGTKGFAGGFGRGALAPFGELLIKEFVQSALDEANKIENGLRSLATEVRVCVLHYAPIFETVVGEPEAIWPFLGSSRLLQPIDTIGCDVVFHGHAHHGTVEGVTPGGIPVYNVAQPLLQERGQNFMVWNVKAPERRASRAEKMKVGSSS